ncbi:MAG: MBL fold metallo-hydrolase [Syntrophomonadaceae bacterium]|nr:MBL fold metallo-hydrolase [Syntrophomonadaceae bacterium]
MDDMMQVHVLASGSTGNAVYIAMGDKRVLVDAGISCRRITGGLRELGVDPSQLDAVLITHEHIDHVKGLEVFTRRYRLPVHARPGVWGSGGVFATLPRDCRHELGERLELGRVQIECVPISHDAVDPVGFVFRCGDMQMASITDVGCINGTLISALAGCDIMVLESNHDVTMLKEGPYPPFLKKRISGNKGHLSNLECGRLLTMAEKHPHRTPHVFLAHMSQQNNVPALARATVERELAHSGCRPGEDMILHLTAAQACASLYWNPAKGEC